VPELSDKVCVITGATSGIGRATALALARRGADLFLVGRNACRGAAVVEKIRRSSPRARAEFLRADLSVQRDVRDLASSLMSRVDRIDVLINNAGARFSAYGETAEGIERTFATNHLSHFLLTALLLDRLLAASSARIIAVGSGAHSGISAEGDWCLAAASYDRKVAYGKSKLANIMFTYELARRLQGAGASANAVDPGGVATNLGRNNGWVAWMRHLGFYALKRQLQSPRAACQTIVHLAGDREVEGVSGRYFYDLQEIRSSPPSYQLEAARQLWTLSVELTSLNAGIGKAWDYFKPEA
jgi:NAD(P)-dependent dehydrogenase (short-subunit alcohol dehydrogenase family)